MDGFVKFLLKASLLIGTFQTIRGREVKPNITRGPSYEHPLRTSNLMCYVCYNEANSKPSDNCVTMANTSKINVLRCKEKEPFCKVRRFETKGVLTTFDRKCSHDCTPGCSQGIINEECISCCRSSLCNTDNGAGEYKPHIVKVILLFGIVLILYF